MAKIKNKENLKCSQRKTTCYVQGNSAETLQIRGEWHDVFKVQKGKNFQPRVRYLAGLSFRIEAEIKGFPDKQKLKEFMTIKPALHEMLKDLL